MANPEHFFAVDVMRYVANKYNIDWTPQEERNTLSPFTEVTEMSIDFELLGWTQAELLLYLRIAGIPYARPFRYLSRIIIEVSIASGEDFLYVCTALARTAIQCYIHGQHDALRIAIEVIEIVLYRYQILNGTDIFQRFNDDIAASAATRS